MRLKIVQRGGADNKWRHVRYKQAVTYFARTLRIPNPKELSIILKLSSAKKMINESKHGNCQKVGPNEYVVTLQRDLPWSQALDAFAHEMVHVHQRATGRLRDRWSPEGICETQWQGGPWLVRERIPYRERPWEKEAFEGSWPLVEGFFEVEQATGDYY